MNVAHFSRALQAALEASGDARQVGPARLDPFPCHGLIADLQMLEVELDDGSQLRLVAKTPTAHAGSREVARMLGMYRREVGFYRDLAAQTPVAVPRCRIAQGGEPDFILLLDYLADARTGDQLAGLMLDEVRRVLAALARVHAHWWNSPLLARQEWLPSLDATWFLEAMTALYATCWRIVRDRFATVLPAHVRARGDAFIEPMRDAVHALSRPPWTLGHGDLRADNVLFPPRGEPVLLDWQLCDRARPARDVAYLVSQALPVDVRRREGAALLDFYRTELGRNGAEPGPDWNDDLRAAATYLFAYGVIASGGVDPRNERGAQLVQSMLERAAALAEDYAGWQRPPD